MIAPPLMTLREGMGATLIVDIVSDVFRDLAFSRAGMHLRACRKCQAITVEPGPSQAHTRHRG